MVIQRASYLVRGAFKCLSNILGADKKKAGRRGPPICFGCAQSVELQHWLRDYFDCEPSSGEAYAFQTPAANVLIVRNPSFS